MPGGSVADVQRYVEVHDLMHLSRREEPIGDAALIEDLDGACVQAACARADEVLAGATSTPASASSPASISPVGPPPAITTAWSVIATPVVSVAAANPAAREPLVDNNALIS